MLIAQTERLQIRRFVRDDAPFLLEMLNSPGWLRYIGDRGVHTVEDAVAYIESRMLASYQKWDYGMYVILRQEDGLPIGSAGLVNREGIDGVDLGFALLPAYEGQGYAFEASEAVLEHARALGLERILAITLPENERSIRLLNRLGLHQEKLLDFKGETLVLMATDLASD